MAEAQDEYWETRDLTTAAYLRCLGIEFVETREEDGDCVWVFMKSPEVTEAMAAFAMDEARVDPDLMVKTYMGLRKVMFQTIDAARAAAAETTGPYGRIR